MSQARCAARREPVRNLARPIGRDRPRTTVGAGGRRRPSRSPSVVAGRRPAAASSPAPRPSSRRGPPSRSSPTCCSRSRSSRAATSRRRSGPPRRSRSPASGCCSSCARGGCGPRRGRSSRSRCSACSRSGPGPPGPGRRCPRRRAWTCSARCSTSRSSASGSSPPTAARRRARSCGRCSGCCSSSPARACSRAWQPALLSDHAVVPAIFKERLSYPLGLLERLRSAGGDRRVLALGLAADVRSRCVDARRRPRGGRDHARRAVPLAVARRMARAPRRPARPRGARAAPRGAVSRRRGSSARRRARGRAAAGLPVCCSTAPATAPCRGARSAPSSPRSCSRSSSRRWVARRSWPPRRLRAAGRLALVTLAIVAVAVPLAGLLVRDSSGTTATGAAVRAAASWAGGQYHDFMEPSVPLQARGQARLLSARGSRSDAYRVALDGLRAAPLVGDGAGAVRAALAALAQSTESARRPLAGVRHADGARPRRASCCCSAFSAPSRWRPRAAAAAAVRCAGRTRPPSSRRCSSGSSTRASTGTGRCPSSRATALVLAATLFESGRRRRPPARTVPAMIRHADRLRPGPVARALGDVRRQRAAGAAPARPRRPRLDGAAPRRDPNPEAPGDVDVVRLDDPTARRLARPAVARRPPTGARACRSRAAARAGAATSGCGRCARSPAPRAGRSQRGDEHLHAHFAAGAALDALRLARLTGLPYSVTAHAYDIFATAAQPAREARARRARASAAATTTSCACARSRPRARGPRDRHGRRRRARSGARARCRAGASSSRSDGSSRRRASTSSSTPRALRSATCAC